MAYLVSGYFDTKYMTVLRIEQILRSFGDQKIANFFKPRTGQFLRNTHHYKHVILATHSYDVT